MAHRHKRTQFHTEIGILGYECDCGDRQYTTCGLPRTKFLSRQTLNMETGEMSPVLATCWVTEPCGVPLFNEDERARGRCSSCTRRWTAPLNYPADPDECYPTKPSWEK